MSAFAAPRSETEASTATRSSGFRGRRTESGGENPCDHDLARDVRSTPTGLVWSSPRRRDAGTARSDSLSLEIDSMRMDATARRHDSNVIVLKSGLVDPLATQARECLRKMAAAVADLSTRVDERFTKAVRLLYSVDGHVVVTGLGKSGLVGRKIAATLASMGTPSFFVHSAEALHGDLGMITEDSAVVLVSYSGETSEVVALLPHLRERRIPTVALVGNPESTLARGVDVALDVSVESEVCPNNLAPTSSTLATLAIGDALAVSLSTLRGFHEEDFARLHPAGSLGRRLMHVGDVVAREGVPVISPETAVRECVLELARSEVPLALVHEGQKLVGVLSSTEIARVLRDAPERLAHPVATVMNTAPPIVSPDVLVGNAERQMEREGLDALLVVDASGEVHGVFARSRKS
jgi:arabinose-5-phosphate isomerase